MMNQNSRSSQPTGMGNNRPSNGQNIVSLPSSPSYHFHVPMTPTHRIPMPPSASNFLHQQRFSAQSPALSPHIPLEDPFHRDEPPHLQYNAHTNVNSRQSYNMPDVRSYFQSGLGPPPPIPPRPVLSRPQTHPCQEPTASMVTVSKTLPSVAHIPLLTGQVDFGAWNNGVRTLILHLGYLGHISDPPLSGRDPLPDHIPSYMPVLSTTSTQDEHAAHRLWWECDHWQHPLAYPNDLHECYHSLIASLWWRWFALTPLCQNNLSHTLWGLPYPRLLIWVCTLQRSSFIILWVSCTELCYEMVCRYIPITWCSLSAQYAWGHTGIPR